MSSSSVSAPPAVATKAAYARFVAQSQKFVMQHTNTDAAASSSSSSSSPTLSAEQIRQIKTALNYMSQSVFVTLRRHLRVAGRQEAEDPSLPLQVAEAQERLKAERMQLHALHLRAQALVDAQLKAPLAHLDPHTGRPLGEAPLAPLPPVDLPRSRSSATASSTAALQSSLAELLTKSDPAALIEADKDLAAVLASRGAKPLSEEVRAMLIQANKQTKGRGGRAAAAATKKGAAAALAASAAAAAASPAVAASAEGYGKVVKSPNSRLSARMAAQPY